MAIKKDQIIEDLDLLRDNLIEETYQFTGKIVKICSDDVLKEIAQKKPLKRQDFLAISGISEYFLNHYADRFLRVIYKHQNNAINEVYVSDNAYKILDNYKDRLTNLSKRNHNLYMGKIQKNVNFDLTQLNIFEDIINFLTNKKISILKLDYSEKSNASQIEKDIINIYRNVNKTEKENGSYDLYIGYPYVEGVLRKESFAIKAPLLFIPVKFKRYKKEFSLKKDKEKDIVFNRDLILAISKFDRFDLDSKAPFIKDISKKTIEEIVLPFYRKIGLNIKNKEVNFVFKSFKNELKLRFVKQKKNVFILKEYITLGRYRLYSSMIQRDIKAILKSNKYNDLLKGLIDETDLYSEEKDKSFSLKKKKVNETNLSYINDINYSQERVIDMVRSDRKLVVWGPPGTGKSQTITNLIAAAVLKGENVLVVSEKKVALDVIYSRLGKSSKYAILIDDAENKQGFYAKMNNYIDPAPPLRTINNDVYEINQQIEKILETLDKSLELLYKNKIKGVPIHKLYSKYLKDREVKPELTPQKVHKMFLDVFNEIDFKELEIIENKFSNKANFVEYLEYRKMITEYPLLSKLNTKITRSNKLELEGFTKRFDFYKRKYDRTWFLGKKRIVSEFIAKRRNDISFLSKKKNVNRQYLELMFKDLTLHNYILENAYKIGKIKEKYNRLSNYQIMFLNMVLTHASLKGIEDITKYYSYLFRANYTGYLEAFKTDNQKYLYILDEYNEKLEELNMLIEKKKKVNQESFEMELYKNALSLSNTKRIMDIKRILDGQRKISVKAFINLFELELMNSVKIWMMTPEVVSATIPLVYGMFDLVIIDEASQMYVEKGIPAIFRAKKVVIAGDSKQLRPSSLGVGRVADEDIYQENNILKDISIDAKSLLDLARYKYKETILNYHYRSSYEELIAFSNYAFYEGKLIVSPNQSQPDEPPIDYIYVKNGVFENRKNIQEAKMVIKLLRKIFVDRKNNETIGVITFNSSQRDLIENYIDEELYKQSKYQKMFEKELFRKDNFEDKSLFVKNIENVQGDERDIIIFSMGYAKDPNGVFKRHFGWLNNDGGQNRLNVAISRAKKKIYFISSLQPEEFKVDDLHSIGPKLLKSYMKYCKYISEHETKLASQLLDGLNFQEQRTHDSEQSVLVQEIKKRLEKNNLLIRTSLGIGNYNIDLAVFDNENKRYTLGIICDIDERKKIDSRGDLFHQEKYLKSRNWKIYRVLASNWYADQNKELKNIRQLLK